MLTINPGDGSDTRGALDIVSDDAYDRFELTWEWRVAEAGNSGLKYFILEDQKSAIGHEYQLIDDERHADAKIGPHRQTSALYDVLAAQNRPMKPAGEFNQSRIVSNGTTVEHFLNDAGPRNTSSTSPALRAAIAKSKFKDVARFGKLQNGYILLQDHGDRVWYRNVKIKRLPPRPRRARRHAGFCRHRHPGRRQRSGAASRHQHRRRAVHLLHLSRQLEEAGALSDLHGEGHAGHARLPARAACR